MLKWHRQPESMDTALEIINYAFLGIFICEAIIKLTALGLPYFSNSWNNFDFIIVMLTIFSVVLEKSGIIGNIGSSTSVIRAFRIGRLLRLIKRAKSLMLIFETLIKALPALANVGFTFHSNYIYFKEVYYA